MSQINPFENRDIIQNSFNQNNENTKSMLEYFFMNQSTERFPASHNIELSKQRADFLNSSRQNYQHCLKIFTENFEKYDEKNITWIIEEKWKQFKIQTECLEIKNIIRASLDSHFNEKIISISK